MILRGPLRQNITNIYKNNPTTEGYKNILITLTIFTIFKLVLSAFNMVLRNELDGKSYRYINNWVAKKLYAKILEVDYDTYQSTDFLNIYQKAVDEAKANTFLKSYNITVAEIKEAMNGKNDKGQQDKLYQLLYDKK